MKLSMELLKNVVNIVLGINVKRMPILKGNGLETELKFFLFKRH